MSPEVDVGGREVVQALVIALMIVVIDEAFDVHFEIAGQIIVEQEGVLERLVPTLDLALRLWMAGRTADMRQGFEPVGEIARDVARAVVREQARLMHDAALPLPDAARANVSVSVTSLPSWSYQALKDDVARIVDR